MALRYTANFGAPDFPRQSPGIQMALRQQAGTQPVALETAPTFTPLTIPPINRVALNPKTLRSSAALDPGSIGAARGVSQGATSSTAAAPAAPAMTSPTLERGVAKGAAAFTPSGGSTSSGGGGGGGSYPKASGPGPAADSGGGAPAGGGGGLGSGLLWLLGGGFVVYKILTRKKGSHGAAVHASSPA